jgi:tyrosine-protein kinase Etk/Wzc
MQDKIQQLEVLRAGEVGSVRLIDTAQAPERPIQPQAGTLLVTGIGGGLFLGFMILLFRKMLDRGVRSVSIIERSTQTSVFAQIPVSNIESKHSHKARSSGILSHESPEEIAVESLRSLRTALEFSLIGPGGRVLGITGLTPGVGKSFVSANLAVLFAKTNKRIILIDSDLRKGKLHDTLGCHRTPGLSEILTGRVQAHDVIHPNIVHTGLSFLATGTIPPNPSELLGSPQLGSLIDTLRSSFDLIIIDTAPLLLVTDPALVLRHVDHACLVLEQGAHALPEIAEGLRLIRSRPDLSTSIALNKCIDSWGTYGRFTKYGKYNLNSKPTH